MNEEELEKKVEYLSFFFNDMDARRKEVVANELEHALKEFYRKGYTDGMSANISNEQIMHL